VSVSVVIPATRPCDDLLWSLGYGTRKPDEIIVISNEVTPKDVCVVRFSSPSVPVGGGDAALRRDIGADVATSDIVLFLDDDLIAPLGLVETAVDIAEEGGFCWGHHRFIDFTVHTREDLIGMAPGLGRSRESGVNRWHGWQSSYAGNLAIKRDLFWEVGGFDLGYLGFHGSEDQQLGRRLGKRNGYQTFVHEPPFAWHPPLAEKGSCYVYQHVAGIVGDHQMVRETVNGHDFAFCDQCPCRYPLDVGRLTMSDEVVIPYSREALDIEKEWT
jgi:hypothetical protein